MTDRERVYILLGSLYDWVPTPSRRWLAKSGFVASKRRQCRHCQGKGKRRVRGMDQDCEPCTGHGWIKIDPYDTLEGPKSERITSVASKVELKQRSRAQILDQEIERLVSLERTRSGEIAHEREPWERAKARQYAAGSYADLDRALAILRDRSHGRYQMVMRFAVHGDDRETLRYSLQTLLDAIVDELRALMPDHLRIPLWLMPKEDERQRKESLHYGRTNGHDRQRAERNWEMWRLRNEEGWAIPSICHYFGLMSSQTYEILAGVDAMVVASGR